MMQSLIPAPCARCMSKFMIRAWTMAGAIRKATITCNCKTQPTK